MANVVKAFKIKDLVEEMVLSDKSISNINRIFDELEGTNHLITKCKFENLQGNNTTSPIEYIKTHRNSSSLDLKKIADKLLSAETAKNGKRNTNIKEGILLIKVDDTYLKMAKLENLKVIDTKTFEIKEELGKEKEYFKLCLYRWGNDTVDIIDKNKKASRYWYDKFLNLKKLRTDEDNTKSVIDLYKKNKIFKAEVVSSSDYSEIRKETWLYIIHCEDFDKSELFNELQKKSLTNAKSEDDLFSDDFKMVDSDFKLEKRLLKRKIQINEGVYLEGDNIFRLFCDELVQITSDNEVVVKSTPELINRIKKKIYEEF